MTVLFTQDPSRGEYYSSAAGDFTVSFVDGTKTVTLSDPGFTVTPNRIKGAVVWKLSGGRYTKVDIPVNDISINALEITFNNFDDFSTGDVVEVYLHGPDKKAALLGLIKDTSGIKKITDDVKVVQPDAGQFNSTEANSGDIKTAVELLDDSVHTDDAAFTATTDKGVAILGVNSSDTVDSDDYGVVKINEDRQQEMAGYSSTSNSQRTSEVDGLDQKYAYEETELTNITTDTTGYIYFDMDGVKNIGIQTEVTNGTDTLTYTLEATNQNDGTAQTDCTYQDVTSDLTGSASFPASDFHLIDTPLPVKYLRLKYVTSNNSGNDCDLTVYSKKLY